MPNIGAPELILILIVALLVIGPGKLPEVGSALGKSIREFRKATTDVQESVRLDLNPPAPSATSAPVAPAPVAPAPVAPTAAAPLQAPAAVAAAPATDPQGQAGPSEPPR